MNPFSIQLNPSLEISAQLNFRLKNKERQNIEISPQNTRLLWPILECLREQPVNGQLLDKAFHNLPLELQSFLVEQGIFLAPSEVPKEALYNPHFDLAIELPSHINLKAPVSLELNINPFMVWQNSDAPPHPSIAQLPHFNRFNFSPPILWVKEPIYGQTLPYIMSIETQSWLNNLIESPNLIKDLPIEIKNRLLYSGFLLPFSLNTQEKWSNEFISNSQRTLEKNKYLILKNLLTPYQIQSLRHYYRQLKSEGYLIRETTPKVNRVCLSHEPVTDFIHGQILGFIQKLVTEAIQPSYSFISYYEESGMGKHRDQDKCLWNLSIMIDPQPETPEVSQWPLFIQFPEHVVEFRLSPGDAVLYQGTQHLHWREPLSKNQSATVALFHFVSQSDLD